MKKETRILYVEDVPADVMMANHELRKTGLSFRVKRVETRDAFTRELESHPPDLILSDHGLPSFDGFTALEIAREKCPHVPFIFVTGSVGEETAIQTFESGATDYVLKKSLHKLGPAVQRALREAEERAELCHHQQALRNAEERYRRLVDACPDAILVLEADGSLGFCNAAAVALYGAAGPGDLLGRRMGDLFPSGTGMALFDHMPAGRPSGAPPPITPLIVEAEILRLDGRTVPVEMSAVPTTFENRPGTQVIAHDITGRQHAEASLRASEALKTAILDTVLDAIISFDDRGRIQEWNAAAQKIFGYTRAEAVGRTVDELIVPPALRQAYADGLAHYLITGASSLLGRPIAVHLQRRDRSEFPAELSVTRVPTEEPPRCTALIRDITERDRAERELRLSEERFRSLVESATDYAIFMLDPEGRVTTWNAGAEAIEGYRADEILGRHFSCVFPPEAIERGRPAELLEQARREGAARDEGWRVRRDGSRYWSNMVLTALRDPAGRLTGFSKISRDITERRAAMEEVQRLNGELEQRVLERTAQYETAHQELESFSYSVSHDLRAPLRHISGYVEIIQVEAGHKLDEPVRQHLQTIADSARQMGHLIDALLAFSRMGNTELRQQPVSLSTLVHEARQEVRRDAQEREVEWIIEPLPIVHGDPLMLRQVMINLLGNALKYTRKRPVARIEVGATETDTETIVHVRDNGVGFDMQYSDKLFGVFQRLHRPSEFEGTGIGLANVRRIIGRHGGKTWASGAVNRGATFYFSLPRLATRSETETDATN